MTTPLLPPYVAPFIPLPNITPFTYKDGETYLEYLERLKCYIAETIVPFVNDQFATLGTDFQTQVNTLIDQVNAAIQTVIDGNIDAQDPLVAQLINTADSDTRTALDARYVTTAVVTDAITTAIAGIDYQAEVAPLITAAGAVKTALDAAYAGQVTDAAVAAIVSAAGATKTALDAAYAGQVTNAAIETIVTTAGATKTALDAAYANQVTDNATVAGYVTGAGATKDALDAAYMPVGSSSGIDETGLVALINDSTTPSPTRAALDALYDHVSDAGMIMIGNDNVTPASVWPSLVIGNGSDNEAPVSVAVGDSVIIKGGGASAGSVAIGYNATIGSDVTPAMNGGIAIGSGAQAIGSSGGGGSIAIGPSAVTGDDGAIVIGQSATANGHRATAIGNSVTAEGDGSVSVGYGAAANGDSSAQLGPGTNTDADSIAFGYARLKFDNIDWKTQTSTKWLINGQSLPIAFDDDSVTDIVEGYVYVQPDTGIVWLHTLVDIDTAAWSVIPLTPVSGAAPLTDNSKLSVGFMMFDTTGGKPIWLKTIDEANSANNVWVDATGATVYPAP